MDVFFKPAEIADAIWMADHLRQSDRDELFASSGYDKPDVVLASSVALGSACVALVDHEPVAIFGAPRISLLPATATPWMIGTEKISEIPTTFGRWSVDIVNKWRQDNDFLINHVDARNKSAIEWLEWLDFDIGPAVSWGPFKMPFHKFTWENTDYV